MTQENNCESRLTMQSPLNSRGKMLHPVYAFKAKQIQKDIRFMLGHIGYYNIDTTDHMISFVLYIY